MTSVAMAQVRQPNGTQVPTRTSTDGPSVSDILGQRGETNLTPPMTPFDAQLNARQDPQTFRPGCRISFRVVARFAGDLDAFGWYNVDPARTTPPPETERYTIVPAANEMSSMAAGGVGFVATLSIGQDPRYRGGDIGFFLDNRSSGGVFYTERRYQPTAVPNYVYALVYDSRVTNGAFYFAWEDLLVDNDNDFNDIVVMVDNLTCTGGGAACTVMGAMGVCAAGTMQCRNAELVCVGTNQPSAERCDGLDNNCDGMVDNGEGLCGERQVCDRGVCVDRCTEELGCLPGFVCTSRGTCMESRCEAISCPTGTVCRGGVCQQPCMGITCPQGQTCRLGRCVDPCAGLTCDADSVCVEGVCQTRCPCRRCGTGESCFSDGRCRPADCVSVTCGAGQYCQGGTCRDACAGAVCPNGGACSNGQCQEPVRDAGVDGGREDASVPLRDVGVLNDLGNGGGDAMVDAGRDSALPLDTGEPTGTVDAPSGSNCACRAGSGVPVSREGVGALAALGLVMAVRRRRRR